MGRRPDLFPVDLRLQACMAVVLALVAVVAVALAAGLLALTLLVPDGWSVAVLVVVLAGVGARVSSRGPRCRRHRGRDVTRSDRRRAEAIVERLCVVGDIAVPRVTVREDPLAQSWTLAVPWQAPRVFLSTGLLDLVDDRSLAAVVAHELGHIAQRDALVMTVAAAPGIWLLGGLRESWRVERRRDRLRAWAVVPLALMLAVAAAPFAVLARALSRLRERSADAAAARLTGSPASVAGALVALSSELAGRRRTDLRAAAPEVLNILPLRPARGLARIWATHPPLEVRLAALDRMEARLRRPAAAAGGG